MRNLLGVMATFGMAVALQAHDAKRPILSSHDEVDGPITRAHRVEDLQVFADGKLVYIEKTAENRTGRPQKSVYRSRIPAEKVRRLADLLNNSELRSLPKVITSAMAPIDFSWRKSLKINHANEIQEINIENFYPFLNLHQPVYPRALIELECDLQEIKVAAAKRPKDEAEWCRALTMRGTTGAASSACSQDSARPEIFITKEGWGPVRLGAPVKAVDAFLGNGQRRYEYNNGYFKQYPPKGIEVSFDKSTDTVDAIFFYHGQQDGEQIGIFCGQTENGIGWQSSVQEVKSAFGKLTAEFAGADWVRLVFDGIDFRFENGKLVRIGVPGK